MEDGSIAAGLFNRSALFEDSKTITVNFANLKIKGPCRVRDLWRQKDLGTFKNNFQAKVPPHGVVLVRIFPQ